MKRGDKFYINVKPKNLPDLYGKELTVGLVWADDSITPIEEFCYIDKAYISKESPEKMKWSLWEKIKILIS